MLHIGVPVPVAEYHQDHQAERVEPGFYPPDTCQNIFEEPKKEHEVCEFHR